MNTTTNTPQPSPEVLAMLADMGMAHPSQATDRQRLDAHAASRDSLARAMDRVGDHKRAKANRAYAASLRA